MDGFQIIYCNNSNYYNDPALIKLNRPINYETKYKFRVISYLDLEKNSTSTYYIWQQIDTR